MRKISIYHISHCTGHGFTYIKKLPFSLLIRPNVRLNNEWKFYRGCSVTLISPVVPPIQFCFFTYKFSYTRRHVQETALRLRGGISKWTIMVKFFKKHTKTQPCWNDFDCFRERWRCQDWWCVWHWFCERLRLVIFLLCEHQRCLNFMRYMDPLQSLMWGVAASLACIYYIFNEMDVGKFVSKNLKVIYLHELIVMEFQCVPRWLHSFRNGRTSRKINSAHSRFGILIDVFYQILISQNDHKFSIRRRCKMDWISKNPTQFSYHL